MTTMEAVAHHLQVQAISRRGDAGERDLFGRSAYNRYYYATFLQVRQMFAKLDSRWSTVPHATYPELLEGTIKREIAKGQRKALKLNDYDTVTLCQQATAASINLAGLMKTGSAIRVIADYHPEIPIDFTSAERFQLKGVEISDAHLWPSRAKAFIATIEEAWTQINV